MFFLMTNLWKKHIQFLNIFPYGARKCKKLDFIVNTPFYCKIKFFAFPGAIGKMLRNWMCFFHKLVIRKNIFYCLLFDLSLLKVLPLVILPLFEIMLYMVKTLKMGFFKNGWRDFFLFLDLRSTQTNTKNGQTSFPCTFFVSKPQSKIHCSK